MRSCKFDTDSNGSFRGQFSDGPSPDQYAAWSRSQVLLAEAVRFAEIAGNLGIELNPPVDRVELGVLTQLSNLFPEVCGFATGFEGIGTDLARKLLLRENTVADLNQRRMSAHFCKQDECNSEQPVSPDECGSSGSPPPEDAPLPGPLQIVAASRSKTR